MICQVNSSIMDIYDQPSPVDCAVLKMVAAVLVVLFITSLTFNTLLLWVFIIHKKFLTPLNVLLMTLVVCNLVATTSELPIVIINNLNCR